MYDAAGALVAKSGLVDFKDWYRNAFGVHSPWGDEDSPALATAVETALKSELSKSVMGGGLKPAIRKLKAGDVLMEQGAESDEVVLLLDGVVSVAVDDEVLAELGPGPSSAEPAAVLKGGRRTSTVTALTRAKVAVVPGSALDPDTLAELSESHRREQS